MDQLTEILGNHGMRVEDAVQGRASLASPESGSGRLHENELFQVLFNLIPFWTTLSSYEEGRIVKANRAFFEFTGFCEEEVIGKTCAQLGLLPNLEERHYAKRLVNKEKPTGKFSLQVRIKTGELRGLIGSACLVRIDNRLYLLAVAKESPVSEKGIKRQSNIKDARWVAEHRFEEMEKAIQILIDRNQEIACFPENVRTVMKKNILPFVENMKMMKLGQKANAYLTIIETNLSSLLSSFSGIEVKHADGLTPAEIHIFELVRQGKTSKEIASLLNVSPSAISFHRNNIRKKIGLHNTSISLNSYLQSSKY